MTQDIYSVVRFCKGIACSLIKFTPMFLFEILKGRSEIGISKDMVVDYDIYIIHDYNSIKNSSNLSVIG